MYDDPSTWVMSYRAHVRRTPGRGPGGEPPRAPGLSCEPFAITFTTLPLALPQSLSFPPVQMSGEEVP